MKNTTGTSELSLTIKMVWMDNEKVMKMLKWAQQNNQTNEWTTIQYVVYNKIIKDLCSTSSTAL